MKTLLIILYSSIIIYSCNNGKLESKSESFASVESMNGIQIFIKSKPLKEYEFLGSIELKWYDKLSELDKQNLQSTINSISGIISFSDNLENVLMEIKIRYPAVEGVIFDDEMRRCEAIIFK